MNYGILGAMGVEQEGHTLKLDKILDASVDPSNSNAYLALTALVHLVEKPGGEYTLRLESQPYHDDMIAATTDEATDSESSDEPVLLVPKIIDPRTLDEILLLPREFIQLYLVEQD